METYGETPEYWLDVSSWASVMYLLDARSRRMEKQKEQEESNGEQGDMLNQIGDHQWGLGV
ncbi:hypothetical protein ACFP7A_01195 [Sporolactobacillus kofuensis]|uniref:Uncharacterized protein n=1 Tax=Sporolactobacillus kofuensis TaxID=269672 RepID=A0ABW1WC94_9BACL|nr:hypothetical protein [Sporolactobacillus kofuensis]MCO7177013.1 hypothetical protein [Sporolactobacillus kofuensis]